jgi:hypothetical protein
MSDGSPSVYPPALKIERESEHIIETTMVSKANRANIDNTNTANIDLKTNNETTDPDAKSSPTDESLPNQDPSLSSSSSLSTSPNKAIHTIEDDPSLFNDSYMKKLSPRSVESIRLLGFVPEDLYFRLVDWLLTDIHIHTHTRTLSLSFYLFIY